MHRLSGLFLAVLAMVALAISGICPADDLLALTAPKLKDPPPATRQQFEKLFPLAEHYPEQGYYTLIINGSSAIVLYDKQEYIAAAIILTQARRNAKQLAELLHMSYDMNRTERGKRFHHAIMYNDRALYRDWPGVQSESDTNRPSYPAEENLKLRPSFTILGSLAAVLRDPDFLFYDWNRRGIVFTNQAHTDKVFVSAHDPQSPIVHFQTENAFKHNSSIFPYSISTFYQAQTKESKAILRLSGLQQIERYDSKEKLVIGKCKDGTKAIGRLSRKYPLDKIPPSAPKAFPKKRSEWPTITLAKLQQENDEEEEEDTASATEKEEPPATSATPSPATPTPEKKKEIHLPLTPKEALDAYLKHLQSF